jgi:acyl carrier protein
MKQVALRRIVAEVLEIDPGILNSQTELTTIETFDSVRVLMLMLGLDEQAGLKLSPEAASQLRYYRDFEQLATEQGFVLTD